MDCDAQREQLPVITEIECQLKAGVRDQTRPVGHSLSRKRLQHSVVLGQRQCQGVCQSGAHLRRHRRGHSRLVSLHRQIHQCLSQKLDHVEVEFQLHHFGGEQDRGFGHDHRRDSGERSVAGGRHDLPVGLSGADHDHDPRPVDSPPHEGEQSEERVHPPPENQSRHGHQNHGQQSRTRRGRQRSLPSRQEGGHQVLPERVSPRVGERQEKDRALPSGSLCRCLHARLARGLAPVPQAEQDPRRLYLHRQRLQGRCPQSHEVSLE